MKTKLLAVLLLLNFTIAKADPPAGEGKAIFLARCAACHNVNKLMTGPALAGIEERRSLDWIVQFVRSSQSLIKSGDKDAVSVYEQFNKVPMPDHPDLTEEHIKDILAYIKSETVAVVETVPFATPSKLQTPYKPLSIKEDYGLFIGFFGIVGVLIMILLFAVHAAGLQRRLREKNVSLPE